MPKCKCGIGKARFPTANPQTCEVCWFMDSNYCLRCCQPILLLGDICFYSGEHVRNVSGKCRKHRDKKRVFPLRFPTQCELCFENRNYESVLFLRGIIFH